MSNVHRMKVLVLGLLGLFVLSGAARAAQVCGTVTVVGVGPIANVEIQFLTAGTPSLVASDVSDAMGEYCVTVPNGIYDVRVIPSEGGGLDPKTLPAYVVAGDQGLDIIFPSTDRRTYSGLVRQEDIGQPGVTVTLYDLQGRFIASAFTDATGRFSMIAPPGDYVRTLSYSTSTPPDYLSYQLTAGGTLDLAASVDETFELEGARRRQLTGTVVDLNGDPVPDASVSLTGNATNLGAYQAVSQYGQDVTDVSGRFAFQIYPGDYESIRAIPPSGSGLGPAFLLASVTDDTDVTITLSPAAPSTTYSGTIVTDGMPIADGRIDLCSVGQCFSSAPTDVDGGFELTVPQGTYSRYLLYGISLPPPRFYYQSYYLGVAGGIDLTAPLHEDFDVEGMRRRELKGTVLDPDGNPLPNLSLGLSMSILPFGPFSYGYGTGSAITDAGGRFAFQMYPGTGTLRSFGSPFSSLVDFLIDVVIGDADRTLGILLQFPGDSAECVTPPGASCSTGDDPTPEDPLETRVDPPADGITRTITIEEQPVTLAPPGGFRFLTQQVHIEVEPPASSEQPLHVTFAFDASRIPAGTDETTLAIFKDGILVPDCTGAPGVADPDPCITLREILPGGDVRLTVLTSTASIWNIGEALLDHFLCYKTKDSKGDVCAAGVSENAGAPCTTEEDCGGATGVTASCVANEFPKGVQVFLADQFGAALVDVKKPLDLCNPADKNGEGIGDTATHLRAYQVKLAKTDPKQEKLEPVRGLRIQNQFHPLLGPLTLDALTLDRLMLPAAKSLAGPIPAPDPATPRIDHYACYKAKPSKGTEKFPKGIQVSLVDQFAQPKRYDLVKPTHLCVPVSKNGVPVLRPDQHLVCYQAKRAKDEPKHARVRPIFVSDQFVSAIVETSAEEQLCVPSRISPATSEGP